MATLSQQFRQFINENFLFGQGTDNLREDDSLLEGGLIDSTGILELIGFIENNFGVAFADEDLVPANLDSIGALVRFVEGKRANVVSQGEADVRPVLS